MTDGPRRSGPSEDAFHGRVFRDEARSSRAPRRGRDAGSDDDNLLDKNHPFTRSLIKTAASTVVPGLGLVRSPARTAGLVITGLFLVGLGPLAVWVVSDPIGASTIAVRPSFLRVISVVLMVTALLWVAQIVGTHVLTRPRRRTPLQRTVGAVAVALLSFVIAVPLSVAARYSMQQSGLVTEVFAAQNDKKSQTRPSIDTGGRPADVWARKPRLNILLVGMDNTAARDYAPIDVSTDTMMVASIDTATGDTVIVQIPRNMAQMQFPKGSELAKRYPRGYYDGINGDNAGYFANAVWAHLPAQNPDLFADTDYKGADALKLGMEGTLGLKIDYFAALNIDGLVKLIDAMGGVRINVNQRIPIGGNDYRAPDGYIEPGPDKQLSGYYAMWYARGRHGVEGGDFNRMGRQTCVIKAVIDQADPATMLTRYEAIANASKQMISTDMPQELLPAMVTLASRVKNGKQTRVLFVHGKDGFVTYDPDFAMMRTRVQRAIQTVGQATGGTPGTTAPKPTSSTGTTPGSPSVTPTGSQPGGTATATPEAESLTDACAYNPVKTTER